jgi:hypothetical protein
MVASASILTFVCQSLAWAECADGTMFPAGGFVNGQAPAATWSPSIFTGTAGSIFVPDNSLFEYNDPTQPLTGGGHNWVFDQGTTFCKETNVGPPGGTPTAWAIPLITAANCLLLPTVRGGVTIDLGDIPYQGDAITPTCNPSLLSLPGAPNPDNTRLNQLGCAISHGLATTVQSATTFLFVAGIRGGLFAVPLVNVANPVSGGEAGKIIGLQQRIGVPPVNYYSGIPEGQKLTNAAVSPDGMSVVATSMKKRRYVYACLNPLGDPGDPDQPIDPNFSVPPANQVKCMPVGSHGLLADLTTRFGPDNQPYFGGQSGVNSFNEHPGGSSRRAWPYCIFDGFVFASPEPTSLMRKLQAVFDARSPNHCGKAQANDGFLSAGPMHPSAMVSEGPYVYAAMGGTVAQFKVTTNPDSGLSEYAFRTYLTGLSSPVTGLGIAEDLQSLMVFTDPSGISLAAREIIIKLPLCEDM